MNFPGILTNSGSLECTWRKVFQGIANAIAYMEGGDVPKAYHGSCEGSLEVSSEGVTSLMISYVDCL